MIKQPAVFLVRGETIIEDIGTVKNTSDIQFYSHSYKTLCILQNHYFIFKTTEQNNTNLTKSYFIAAYPSDVHCGINAGVAPLYLYTCQGNKHKSEFETETIINDNISDAIKYINLEIIK